MTSQELAAKVMGIDQKLESEGAYGFCVVCGDEYTKKSLTHGVCPSCAKRLLEKRVKEYEWQRD